MTGKAHGRILDMLMGFGGAVVIGMWADRLSALGLWGFVFACFSALLGGILLTVLTAFMNEGRMPKSSTTLRTVR